ncbi:MAG TPA: dihydroneopterin aldolase [Chthoniobacterales bacterium]|jgi:FolB domain-containing protein
MSGDWIEIRGLEVDTHIGVPETERATPQRLLVDVRLKPPRRFSEMPDSIAATVDYFALAQRIVSLAAEHSRRLIETLADDIADMVMRETAVQCVEVSVRKFILPNAEFVAVHCTREK